MNVLRLFLKSLHVDVGNDYWDRLCTSLANHIRAAMKRRAAPHITISDDDEDVQAPATAAIVPAAAVAGRPEIALLCGAQVHIIHTDTRIHVKKLHINMYIHKRIHANIVSIIFVLLEVLVMLMPWWHTLAGTWMQKW